MSKETIQVPEKGTYQWQLFDYWSGEYRQTHADHSAYIALNFAGALDACRHKFKALIQHHRQQAACANSERHERHQRAIARLQNTMSGAAMAYESVFSGINEVYATPPAGPSRPRVATLKQAPGLPPAKPLPHSLPASLPQSP